MIMRVFSPSLYLYFVMIFSWAILSCDKQRFGDEKPYAGKWEILEVKTNIIDSLGNTTERTIQKLGTIELIRTYEDDHSSMNLLSVSSKAVYDSIYAFYYLIGGADEIYWYPDLHDKRIFFWSIKGANASFVQVFTIQKLTKKEMEWTWVGWTNNNTTTQTLKLQKEK